MPSVHLSRNIRSVANTKHRILVRSLVFSYLHPACRGVFLGFFNFAMMLMEGQFQAWGLQISVHPIYPILTFLLFLNTGQGGWSQFSFLRISEKGHEARYFRGSLLWSAPPTVMPSYVRRKRIWGKPQGVLFMNLLVLAIVACFFNFMRIGRERSICRLYYGLFLF